MVKAGWPADPRARRLVWFGGVSVAVVAVVALVTPILVLAYKIGTQARELNTALSRARDNTAGLAGLNTTIDHATEIIGGLQRGRARLGG